MYETACFLFVANIIFPFGLFLWNSSLFYLHPFLFVCKWSSVFSIGLLSLLHVKYCQVIFLILFFYWSAFFPVFKYVDILNLCVAKSIKFFVMFLSLSLFVPVHLQSWAIFYRYVSSSEVHPHPVSCAEGIGSRDTSLLFFSRWMCRAAGLCPWPHHHAVHPNQLLWTLTVIIPRKWVPDCQSQGIAVLKTLIKVP